MSWMQDIFLKLMFNIRTIYTWQTCMIEKKMLGTYEILKQALSYEIMFLKKNTYCHEI